MTSIDSINCDLDFELDGRQNLALVDALDAPDTFVVRGAGSACGFDPAATCSWLRRKWSAKMCSRSPEFKCLALQG